MIAFDLYLRTGRRTRPLEVKFNPHHDPANGQFTFGAGGGAGGGGSGNGGSRNGRASSSGARLTPEAGVIAERIRHDFFLRTGKRVRGNSGTRSPKSQADAMLGKLDDWGIYKDQKAIAEIRAAYRRSKAAGAPRDEQANAMAEVIDRQMSRGVYVSDHLKSHALDLSVQNLSARERAILVEVSKRHSKRVLDEHSPQHVHVKY